MTTLWGTKIGATSGKNGAGILDISINGFVTLLYPQNYGELITSSHLKKSKTRITDITHPMCCVEYKHTINDGDAYYLNTSNLEEPIKTLVNNMNRKMIIAGLSGTYSKRKHMNQNTTICPSTRTIFTDCSGIFRRDASCSSRDKYIQSLKWEEDEVCDGAYAVYPVSRTVLSCTY
jgi:hypothetical protein